MAGLDPAALAAHERERVGALYRRDHGGALSETLAERRCRRVAGGWTPIGLDARQKITRPWPAVMDALASDPLSPRVVVIEGDAGLGKSVLLMRTVDAIGHGVNRSSTGAGVVGGRAGAGAGGGVGGGRVDEADGGGGRMHEAGGGGGGERVRDASGGGGVGDADAGARGEGGFYVEAAALVRALASERGLVAAAAACVGRQHGLARAAVRMGAAWLAIDDVDALESEARAQLLAALAAPGPMRCVLAMRPGGVRPRGATVWQLLPFDAAQRRQVIERRLDGSRAAALRAHLTTDPALDALAEVPLFCAAACELVRGGADPRTLGRRALYRSCLGRPRLDHRTLDEYRAARVLAPAIRRDDRDALASIGALLAVEAPATGLPWMLVAEGADAATVVRAIRHERGRGADRRPAPDHAATAPVHAATAPVHAATGPDHAATVPDHAATASDRASTASDRAATASDRASAASDRASAASERAATASDRASTAFDRAGTAPDRAALGLVLDVWLEVEAPPGGELAPVLDEAALWLDRGQRRRREGAWIDLEHAAMAAAALTLAARTGLSANAAGVLAALRVLRGAHRGHDPSLAPALRDRSKWSSVAGDVERGLDDGCAMVRWGALWAATSTAMRRGEPGFALADRALALIDDPAPAVRSLACRAAVALGCPDAPARLRAVFAGAGRDADARTSEPLAHDDETRATIAGTSDDDPRAGGPGARDNDPRSTIAGTSDDDPRASRLVAHDDDPRSTIAATSDDDARAGAAVALGALATAAAVEVLLAAADRIGAAPIEHDDPVPAAVFGALESWADQLARKQALPVEAAALAARFVRALERELPRVGAIAASGLGKIGELDAASPLAALLDGPHARDPRVEASAAFGLERICARFARAHVAELRPLIPRLRERLDGAPVEVRRQVAGALQHLAVAGALDDDALRALAVHAGDDDDRVAAACILGLAATAAGAAHLTAAEADPVVAARRAYLTRR